MTDAARQAIGNFTLSLNVTDRRGISLQGVIYSDDGPDELNARLDAMQDALDRQAVRCDIVNKEAQIAAHAQNLELIREQYEMLAAKQRGGRKLTSMEKQGLDNFEPSVKRAREMIEGLQAAIASARAKYGFA